jgi:hypothetical protein
VRRFDRETGEPVILLRFNRRVALTQEAFTITPGRLRHGRVWVAGGNWRGPTADVAELVLQPEASKIRLFAGYADGGRDEIYADDEGGRAARELADWLSAVANIPVSCGDGAS